MSWSDRDFNWVLKKIEGHVGDVDTTARDPFDVLVATLISLRTKDEVTDVAARKLLARAGDARSLSRMRPGTVEKLIYPAGFYRNKARTLIQVARELLQRHGGQVPGEMDALLALKGVGRKTANLVLVRGFAIPAVCVDTHVHRICNRLGYVATAGPDETEQVLRAKLPRRHWLKINQLLVWFGQQTCTPLSPRCSTCVVSSRCGRVEVGRSR